MAAMSKRWSIGIEPIHQSLHQVLYVDFGVVRIFDRQTDIDHVTDLVVMVFGSQPFSTQDLSNDFTTCDSQRVSIRDDGVLSTVLLPEIDCGTDRHEGGVILSTRPMELVLKPGVVVCCDSGWMDQMLMMLGDVQRSRAANAEEPLYVFVPFRLFSPKRQIL